MLALPLPTSMVMSEQQSRVALAFRRLLRRLAQFRPFGKQSQLEQASGEFVLAAIYENGGSVSSRARSLLRRSASTITIGSRKARRSR